VVYIGVALYEKKTYKCTTALNNTSARYLSISVPQCTTIIIKNQLPTTTKIILETNMTLKRLDIKSDKKGMCNETKKRCLKITITTYNI